MGYGRKLRESRKHHPHREGYRGQRFLPRSVEVHRQFIVENLCFNAQLSKDCSNLRDVYRKWLSCRYPSDFDSEIEEKNNVDLNFLYEEIEVMSGGIAEWHGTQKNNHHFIGVDLLRP